MARHCVAASSQYLERTGVPVTGVPCTLSLWVKTSTPSVAAFGGTLCRSSSNAWIALGANLGDGNMKAYEYDGTTPAPAIATVPLPTSAWTHLCGVFTTDAARACFLNGANKGTNTTATAAPILDRVTVGTLYVTGAPTLFWDGDLAELAIYNVALSDAEVAQLAAGQRANTVHAANLVAYYPLLGTQNPEPDTMGGTSLTLVNGPTFAPHPPLLGSPAAGRMFAVF